jgi:hypothetical protein
LHQDVTIIHSLAYVFVPIAKLELQLVGFFATAVVLGSFAA